MDPRRAPEDWRGSSAGSGLGSPSRSRADRVGVDSSTPSSARTPADATPPLSQAAPPAGNYASSSRASTARPRRSDPSLSAGAAAGAPSTRRVAAEARGSPASTPGAYEPWIVGSQGESQAI